MVGFKEQFLSFSKSYNEEQKRIGSHLGIEIVNCSFDSEYSFDFSDKGFVRGNLFYHELVNRNVAENSHFNYPVVVPDTRLRYESGILLFHGLNERNWDKYFVWAKYLAEKTQRPVVLFPIAYHMNRAPKAWSNPRMMTEIANSRKMKDQESNSTFANAALSTRLEFHPELFIYSGLHTCCDVQQLLREIKTGENELFSADAHFDIFSYSIGSFLSQILLLSNPDSLFDDTKLFIFCGGPTFDRMNGNSKYIMDMQAFNSLLTLKHRRRLKAIRRKVIATGDSSLINTWPGLELMMYSKRGRTKRDDLFGKIGSRIKAIALEKDKVMPVAGIIETLRGKRNDGTIPVEVIDFPFEYSHEQPFPVGDDKIQSLVDRSFTVVFDKAVSFFNS
jgi:hypothetical protein